MEAHVSTANVSGWQLKLRLPLRDRPASVRLQSAQADLARVAATSVARRGACHTRDDIGVPASVLASGAPGTARLLQEGAGLCRLLHVAQTIGLSSGSPSPADIEPSSWPARVAGGWRGASRCLALAIGVSDLGSLFDRPGSRGYNQQARSNHKDPTVFADCGIGHGRTQIWRIFTDNILKIRVHPLNP